MKRSSALRLTALFGLAALASLAGCSSIVNGHDQSISINSNVRDADIAVDGRVIGRTPFTGLVNRSHGATVTVSKAGYQSKTVTLDTDVEPWFFGNILFGGAGLFASSTDAGTGAMYRYSPTTIEVDLEVASAGK